MKSTERHLLTHFFFLSSMLIIFLIKYISASCAVRHCHLLPILDFFIKIIMASFMGICIHLLDEKVFVGWKGLHRDVQCERSDAISPNILSLSLEVKSRGEDGAHSRNSKIEITEVSLLIQCYFTDRLCFSLINCKRWQRDGTWTPC